MKKKTAADSGVQGVKGRPLAFIGIIGLMLTALLYAPLLSYGEAVAGLVVTVASTEAAPGAYTDVRVSFEGNPGVAAFALELRYDAEKLEPVLFTPSAAWNTGIMTSNIQSEEGAVDGNVSTVWVNATDFAGNGTVFTVRFKVSSGENGDVIPISAAFKSGGIVNQNLEDVKANVVNGKVTVAAGSAAGPEDGTPPAAETGDDTLPAKDIDPGDGNAEDVWINPFSDVKSGDWFYGAVEYVCAGGLMRGISEREFAPNLTVSRAMLVTVLHRAAGEPEAPPGGAFTDVPENQWYTAAIAWASADGIVSGVGGGKFAPDEPVTREQFATILYRYAVQELRIENGEWRIGDGDAAIISGYDDAGQISGWASDAVKWAVAKGLMTGRSTTELAPKGALTRAEAATILSRLV
ncbi:MAG: S-layer homology domain-containing protein [Oscillospiraceae bacterium]|nr:S-layer homology domain-containing protein [Oscillospiraceae bacterium]